MAVVLLEYIAALRGLGPVLAVAIAPGFPVAVAIERVAAVGGVFRHRRNGIAVVVVIVVIVKPGPGGCRSVVYTLEAGLAG